MSATELREHDVVRYTPERTWCRDGVAKAVRRSNGRIVLCETYWRSQGDDSVVAPTEYEVLFNLNDYELVKQYQWEEFAPGDRQLIRAQHGHCPEFYVRRGAAKSHEQIVANAREALAEAEERLRSVMRGIEHFERAEELAEHANVALTTDGDRAEAQVLTALAQVHVDLAHVAALTGWDRARTTTPGHGPYAEVPVR